MPAGIETFVDEGFAEITVPDKALRAEVLGKILEHTPAPLVEKDTRKGKYVVYRIPEGNARAAGLIDGDAPSGVIPIKGDMGKAQALVDADPKTTDKRAGGVQHGEYGTILPTVADTAYQAMPTTRNNVHDGDLNFVDPQDANGKIRAELRPNKNVADPNQMIDDAIELLSKPVVSLPAAALQEKIRLNTPRPNDYARARVPRDQLVPSSQATIAATVDRAPQSPAEPAVGIATGPNAGRVVEGQPGGDAGPTTVSAPDIIAEQRELSTADAPDVLTPAKGEKPNDGWKVDELREYAKANDIDLGGATKKADILKALEGK